MKLRSAILALIVGAFVCMVCGCSSVKHVPPGRYLLDEAVIKSDNDSVQVSELYSFLRQVPNHKFLGMTPLQLHVYSLSGSDSSKWYNRWLRRIGQAPVVYDPELTEYSQRQLHQALVNRGYMDVSVTVDTVLRRDKRQMRVTYNIATGVPRRISDVAYDIQDTAIATVVYADTLRGGIRRGDLFDRNVLDKYRGHLTELLRNNGYYALNKDVFVFTADTVRGSKDVALTMSLRAPVSQQARAAQSRWYVRNVYFVTDYDPQAVQTMAQDTVYYHDIAVIYGSDRYLRPKILDEKNYIVAGEPYSARAVEQTYEALGQLSILKFINIEMRPVGTQDGREWMDAYVLLSRNRKQGITLELEGTNSEGDFGFGAGATYQHRNLAKGSEELTAKFRTSYESLSGNFEGLVNNRYNEYAGEVGLTIPKFEAPFLSKAFKMRMRASTEFAVSFNWQERPEYTRAIASAAWKYKWTQRRRQQLTRRTFDLVDINYVRLPRSTINFLDSIAPENPLLRYSYEDHFIMRMGYQFYRTDRRIPTANVNAFAIQPSVTTIRATVETAGNLLYGISNLIGQRRSDGAYKIFDIQYAQYVRGEVDYTYTRNFNSRNALAFHVGGGIEYPYGNSSMVPFEKRFYAGGANGVRGWGVRTLGPGSYDSRNSVANFINQCGDIRLDLSVEYRAKLFWVIESALFVDAGNIWTIKDYPTQPGGMFRFNEFYKQIAAAYGVGIRLDFTYFLFRFDLGMKAHNPAMHQEPWPLLHPRWKRDHTFHFSVGYPF